MKFCYKKNLIFFLLFFYLISSFIVLYVFDGTGERGSGDSILHYLYAKYAITNPELFLHHWAKPLFVLLSFPFAIFGLVGIKLFNVIVTLFTLFYTYKTALEVNYKNAIIASVILLCTPLYFILTFSGLTEPLFALFTIYSTYLFVRKKYLLGSIVLSFLPFIRSEGLLIIGVFGVFLLLKKQWKLIPYLVVGHLVYSIVGYFYYQDILWVFTKIPYAKLSSTYNSGEIFHFVHQLFHVIGAPIYILLSLGIISIIYQVIKKKLFNETSVLILGSFITYFTAHSLFWYLGIFNSMGLKRVLIAVAPLIALISLQGFNLLTENTFIKNQLLRKGVSLTLFILITTFPFTSNKSAINWEKDFCLMEDQLLEKELVSYLNDANLSSKTYSFSSPYLAELLNINYFDESLRAELSIANIEKLEKGNIIIWDNWFGIVENGISEKKIRSIDTLQEIKTFKTSDKIYILFIKR